MINRSFSGRYAAALLVFAMSASPAAALTGEDLMTKMSQKERFSFIAGAVEMVAFLSKRAGNGERSTCIMDWFFDDGVGASQIEQALAHFSDRQTHPVILVTINRACGE